MEFRVYPLAALVAGRIVGTLAGGVGTQGPTRNLAYLESLVRAVYRPGKPTLLGEFGWYGGGRPHFDGGGHPAATSEQQARYCRRIIETSAGFVCGWLNWGLYDNPQANDVSELTGLLKVT